MPATLCSEASELDALFLTTNYYNKNTKHHFQGQIKYQTDDNTTPHVKMGKRGKLTVGPVSQNHASFILISITLIFSGSWLRALVH